MVVSPWGKGCITGHLHERITDAYRLAHIRCGPFCTSGPMAKAPDADQGAGGRSGTARTGVLCTFQEHDRGIIEHHRDSRGIVAT